MDRQPPIDPDRLSTVTLHSGDRWVRLSLRLGEEFTGGDLLRFSPDATVSVEGADELSSSYGRDNWASGIASGALYAFRALHITRQQVAVLEFAGRLRASDMDAAANASAVAIAQLAGRELPAVDTSGWEVQAQVAERRQPTAAGAAQPTSSAVAATGDSVMRGVASSPSP